MRLLAPGCVCLCWGKFIAYEIWEMGGWRFPFLLSVLGILSFSLLPKFLSIFSRLHPDFWQRKKEKTKKRGWGRVHICHTHAYFATDAFSSHQVCQDRFRADSFCNQFAQNSRKVCTFVSFLNLPVSTRARAERPGEVSVTCLKDITSRVPLKRNFFSLPFRPLSNMISEDIF